MTSERPSLLRPPSAARSSSLKPDGQISPRQARRKPNRATSSENSLRLPGLPRFHPANFPSAHSSVAGTPSSEVTSPEPPMSPRTQQRQLSEAQQQLYNYQRELLATAGKGGWVSTVKPKSPTLAPCGSPGPVTPLELEGDNYLMAGMHSPAKKNQEYVEQLIRDGITRSKAELSQRTPTTVGSY